MKYAKKFFGFHNPPSIDNVVVTKMVKPCVVCGEATCYMAQSYKVFVCSEECLAMFNDSVVNSK